MSLVSRSNNRSNARRRKQISAPAEIETFEARLLLTTTPGILSPTGTIQVDAAVDGSTPNVVFTWEAVDNAVSYDLWISSLGSYQQILLKDGANAIVGNSTEIPVTDLAEGKLRVWARANLADGGVSSWSSGRDFTLNVRPVVTGPGDGARNLTADTTPVIEWAATNEAQRFQIWLTNLTTGVVQRYDVPNLTPLLDADGNPVLDYAGRTIPEEIRAFEIPINDTLEMGQYRAWVRAIDIDGVRSNWSDPYQFEVGPKPQNLSPNGQVFSTTPQLSWDAVAGATAYEVFINSRDANGVSGPVYRGRVTKTTFDLPTDLKTLAGFENNAAVQNLTRLDVGVYSFWVRAIKEVDGLPTVFGAWSDKAEFPISLPLRVVNLDLNADSVVRHTPAGTTESVNLVTQLRPTIEWSAIHGAATYEVLVHRSNSRPPYLQTFSNETSMTFANDLYQGTYTVWVRAINTRGSASDWSDPLFFEVTGQRTVITAPAAGEVVDFPTFTWIDVADAASYEIWISQIGGSSPFINVAGINGTSYTPIDPALPNASPLPDGDYRVWVRTLFTDGTQGPWSAAVSFVGGIVVENEVESTVEIQLTSLQTETTEDPSVETAWQPDDSVPADLQNEQRDYAFGAPTDADRESVEADGVTVPSRSSLPTDVLSKLAQECAAGEWWADDHATA